MALSPFYSLDRDPFTAMRHLQEEVNRAFAVPRAAGFPAVNIWQGIDSSALTAEIPGVDPSDLDISVKEDVVTIAGERRPPEVAEGTAWQRRERAYGRFSRAIRLPYRVDPDRVEARVADGVLEIELHQPEADKPRRIAVKAA
jgi:HSP20 family protein